MCKAKLFSRFPTVLCVMKPIYLLMHEFVHSYRILEFCKWDLAIALGADLRLELDFQAKNEFAGL